MGTGTHSRATETIKCEVCRREPFPACDHQQGRCPYGEPPFQVDITVAEIVLYVLVLICMVIAWNLI